MEAGDMSVPLLQETLPYVRAGYQTAGRGQLGNGWESERGKNLTYSMLIRSIGLRADEQWRMNMLIPVVLCEVVERYLNEEERHGLTIKWPNDIYIGDKKLAGILIEHTLIGKEIGYSIVGVGLNVNQDKFVSAPNPTSLKLVTGIEYDLDDMMEQIRTATCAKMELVKEEEILRHEYMNRLYRRNGYYPYVEREVSVDPTMNAMNRTLDSFEAEIKTITPQGQLVLRLRSGEEKTYHFKQIRYVVEQTS